MNAFVLRVLASLKRRNPFDDWQDVYNAETRRLPAVPHSVPDYYERLTDNPAPRRSE